MKMSTIPLPESQHHQHDVPADFDASAHPIIAEHWFGVDPLDFDPPHWSRRCPVVDVELRRMYWRLHRHGVVLPAEAGVILFEGGAR